MNMQTRYARLMVILIIGLTCISARSRATGLDAVAVNYANMALATYEDSLETAKVLQRAIGELAARPSKASLEAARRAWISARIPYQQSEAFRFGNKIVDDWEGKVNAWPLDEGLIDYVAGSYGRTSDTNPLYVANVIANKSLYIAGRRVDAGRITKEFLSGTLHEAGRIEANVATGYHAIEFLLWGQDLNGTERGAGNRPVTDFDLNACTGGNCERRVAYLKAATDLLVDELSWMVAQWKDNGSARKSLMDRAADQRLIAMFTGMGSLSYGELAGERMKLGLLLHDPEEEHDCFSDNTHSSHYNDVIGIQNVYLGRYSRVDGTRISGPSLSDLVKAQSPEVDQRMRAALDETVRRMTVIVERAKGGEAYDQMIGAGNEAGNAVIENAIEALLQQTKEIERAIAVLKLKPIQFEGSKSLGSPNSSVK